MTGMTYAVKMAGAWYHIPRRESGAGWGGEQCESCGSSGFTVRRTSDGWKLVCTGDDFNDGCGERYTIAIVDSRGVIY